MSASQGASIATAMTVAWVAGWLSGLWVGGSSRRHPRSRSEQIPEDWRRRFSHENTNRPGGPPPLLYHRCEPDERELFIPFTPGPLARSNNSGMPAIPKPVITPQGQGPWQPLPQQGAPNPPPPNP